MRLNIRKSVILPIGLLFTVLVLTNAISRNWFFRLDLTENKMYSLSESSRRVVAQVKDLLTLKVYFSDDLPGEYGNNRRYLQDILEEYSAYSKGNIRFEFIVPESDQELEKEAQKEGIMPVQLQVIENDKMEVKRVFMGLAMLYEDKKEILPLIQTTTGLEYEITTRIKKLVEQEKKVLAIAQLAGQDNENSSIHSLLNQRYNVKIADLNNAISLDIDVLLMNGVSDTLSREERINLENYVARGGNLFIAQNRVKTSLQTQQAKVIESDIFEILLSFGFNMSENLILDRICGRVNVMQNMGFIRMNVPMDYPLLPVIRHFNKEEPAVAGLEQVQLLFPSEIRFDSTAIGKINFIPLMYSSNQSGTMEGRFNLSPDPKMNPGLRGLNQKGKLLAARSEISQGESGLISQVVLVSDSQFMLDEGGGRSPENHIFLLNMVDFLMGDSELIVLRSREITSRPLKNLTDQEKKTWKWFNIILPSLLVVSFGFMRMHKQRRRTNMLEELYD